jgi:dolichol-phosphate mannosyltransferase
LIEMLHAAAGKGLRMTEVPITFVERRLGESKLTTGVLLESAIAPWRLVGHRR